MVNRPVVYIVACAKSAGVGITRACAFLFSWEEKEIKMEVERHYIIKGVSLWKNVR